MAKYLEKVKFLLGQFRNQRVTRIPHSENIEADALARLASGSDVEGLVSFPVERLDQLSIEREEQVLCSESAATWMDPIVHYLRDSQLPETREKVRRIKNSSARYMFINGKLYRWGHSAPYQRCVGPAESEYVMKEIHSGVCGTILGGKPYRSNSFGRATTGRPWEKT